MKILVTLLVLLVSFAAGGSVRAQSSVVTLSLASDRIGDIKTAQGITTMIRFTEPVQEIVCGDLYDPSTGKGTFVVQRGGTAEQPGNDVFIKPVSSKGASNMFVKTGDGKHIYSFDLSIVTISQAHRMITVIASSKSGGAPATDNRKEPPGVERLESEVEQQALQKAAEIMRSAQLQIERKTAEAEASVAEINRQAALRADQDVNRRFAQALMLGMRELKGNNTRVTANRVIVTLDSRMLLSGNRAYLRYTIQNNADKKFAFTTISLEAADGNETTPVAVEVTQSKAENWLAPSESVTGVIVFDPKQLGSKQRLTLLVRGMDSTEVAHVAVQQ